jgi:hypothetical protein
MANFKKTIATAKAKVAEADAKAFEARLEAIDAILEGATPHDAMTLCAQIIARVAPLCCEQHQDEFKAEFLRMLSDCIALEQEAEVAATADEAGGVLPPVRH